MYRGEIERLDTVKYLADPFHPGLVESRPTYVSTTAQPLYPNPPNHDVKHSSCHAVSGSALISGIGSNMSLPSCIPQDQEFLPGQTGAGCKTALLNNRNQPGTEKNEHEALKQRPNFLPLAPVGAGCVNALEPVKGERVLLENRSRTERFINREICAISMQRSNGPWMKS